MKFTKGAIVGMMAGAIIGAMNSDKINSVFRDTKRQMRRFRKKYGM